jgi:hypothetical protein
MTTGKTGTRQACLRKLIQEATVREQLGPRENGKKRWNISERMRMQPHLGGLLWTAPTSRCKEVRFDFKVA